MVLISMFYIVFFGRRATCIIVHKRLGKVTARQTVHLYNTYSRSQTLANKPLFFYIVTSGILDQEHTTPQRNTSSRLSVYVKRFLKMITLEISIVLKSKLKSYNQDFS